MNEKLERVARGLLKPINPYASCVLGALTFVWGFWIVNPWWDVFGTAAIWTKAGAFAPEWAWGTWSTLCGLFILLSLLKPSFHSLVWCLGFAIWHWGTVSIMLWWGDWQNTAGVTYTFIFIWTVYSYLNIKFNWLENDYPPEL